MAVEAPPAFETRQDAGRLLAERLRDYAGGDTIVVGLTRGGMAVAAQVARVLGLPLDTLVVHRLGGPAEQHMGLGVVAEPGHVVMYHHRARALALASAWLEAAVAQGIAEVNRRGELYRRGRQRQSLEGRRTIVVDDSASTGTSLWAALTAVRAMGAREIVVAIPVAPGKVVEALRPQAARVVCLASPAELIWQGIHYPARGEVGDDDIRRLLERWL
jgi:putative phosphoribosyl transferase